MTDVDKTDQMSKEDLAPFKRLEDQEKHKTQK
jgi:hypothetical protein